jgi:hypothetical protein
MSNVRRRMRVEELDFPQKSHPFGQKGEKSQEKIS